MTRTSKRFRAGTLHHWCFACEGADDYWAIRLARDATGLEEYRVLWTVCLGWVWLLREAVRPVEGYSFTTDDGVIHR